MTETYLTYMYVLNNGTHFKIQNTENLTPEQVVSNEKEINTPLRALFGLNSVTKQWQTVWHIDHEEKNT